MEFKPILPEGFGTANYLASIHTEFEKNTADEWKEDKISNNVYYNGIPGYAEIDPIFLSQLYKELFTIISNGNYYDKNGEKDFLTLHYAIQNGFSQSDFIKYLSGYDNYFDNEFVIKNHEKFGEPEFLKTITTLPDDLIKLRQVVIEQYEMFGRVRLLMKQNRIVHTKDNLIEQHCVLGNKEDISKMKITDFVNNPEVLFFNNWYHVFLKIVHLSLNRIYTIVGADIQMFYYSYQIRYKLDKNDEPVLDEYGDRIPLDVERCGIFRYTTPFEDFSKNINPLDIQFKISSEASGYMFLFLGYKIVFNSLEDLNKDDIMLLKAYQPTTNRKFHDICTSSTSMNKICIYETFLEINDKLKLEYMKKNTSDFKINVKNKLNNEGLEILESVKNGYMVKSLELLTKKYKSTVLILFFGTLLRTGIEDKYWIELNDESKAPIKIKCGITSRVTDLEKLNKFSGKKIMLYDESNNHIAPSIFGELCSVDYNKIIKTRQHQYKLEHKILTDEIIKLKEDEARMNGEKLKIEPLKSHVEAVLGFDFETITNPDTGYSEVYCATLIGELDGTKHKNNGEPKKLTKTTCEYDYRHLMSHLEVDKSFYGLGCVTQFVKYLDTICTKSNTSKTKYKLPIKFIHIYGFNNSRFDNLTQLYQELFKLNPGTDYKFANNSIKFIQFHNIKIFDISLFYKLGSLRDTCKLFKLEREKDYFPHNFVNKDTLNYIGPIPDREYWNDGDYDNFIENNVFDGKIIIGNDKFLCNDYELAKLPKNSNKAKFDLKKICIEYCSTDSDLAKCLGMCHLNNCVGKINDRYYNVESSLTAAGMSLSLFKQCFLTFEIKQSPDEIVDIEKAAYKGGRTEVFKKTLLRGTLDYHDINSSYPRSMLDPMPDIYIRRVKLTEREVDLNRLIDYNLYLSKVIYCGDDKHYIPNILVRIENGSIVGLKNTDYEWQWGCELKEAILDGCKIYIKEEIIYKNHINSDGSNTFQKFSEYFYNERLKVKNVNPALAQFYKTSMNSLYGKFGQRLFDQTILCKSLKGLYSHVLNNESRILVDIHHIDDDINLVKYKDCKDEYNSPGKLMRFASYITALSRCRLAQFMRNVGHSNVYYCDTDSVFSSSSSPPDPLFIDQNILGKWKKECDPIHEAYFIAKKTYYYDCGKICQKAKGIRGDKLDKCDYLTMLGGGNISQDNVTFFRGFNGVQIRNQIRNIEAVHKSRKFYNNESEAYNDINEYKQYVK